MEPTVDRDEMRAFRSEGSRRLRLLLIEKELAHYWLKQSYLKPEAKRSIRERLIIFEAEIRQLLRQSRTRSAPQLTRPL
jgi:hypothetical protein